MIDRKQIVEAARSYIGAKWKHEGRSKEFGVDCVGLVLVVGKQLNAFDTDFNVSNYSRNPDGAGTLLTKCHEFLGARVGQSELQIGDIVVVRSGNRPSHVGIVGDYQLTQGKLSLIHASNNPSYLKVVEHRLEFGLGMSFVAGFKFPRVE